MFHDSHELNDIIAELFDPGQNVGRELWIRTDAILSCGYSN
jgi:hypothetical protein